MRCFIQIQPLARQVITVYVLCTVLMTGLGAQKHCHAMEIAV